MLSLFLTILSICQMWAELLKEIDKFVIEVLIIIIIIINVFIVFLSKKIQAKNQEHLH